MAYELPETDTKPIQLKGNIDPTSAAKLLDPTRETPPSPHEFFRAINPKDFPEDLTPGPMPFLDTLANKIGLQTDNFARRRNANQLADAYMPAYQKFLGEWEAYHAAQALVPTTGEAMHRGLLPSPSVHPSTMMPGPRVTTPGNLDAVIGGNLPAIGDPQVRPGLQPEGVPQQTGPFGLPQPYQPGVLSTTPLVPQYQFPTNDPGPMVPNMQAPLRPIDQGIVKSRISALAHPRAAAAQGAAEFSKIREDLLSELQAAHPKTDLTPAEISYASQVAGKVFGQGARPGSLEYEGVKQKNSLYPGESAALTAKNLASAEQDHALAEDIWNYTQTKNERGKAETRSLNAGVVHAEQRVQTAQDKAAIEATASKLAFWKANMAWDTMNLESRQKMMMLILKDVLPEGVQIGPEELGWFESIFKTPKMSLQSDALSGDSVMSAPGRAYTPQGGTPAPEPGVAPETPQMKLTQPLPIPKVPQQAAEELLRLLDAQEPDYEHGYDAKGQPQKRKKVGK